MGHAQSAQHNFHHPHHPQQYHPHHRAGYPRPSPGGSAGDGSSEAEDAPRWSTHSFPRDPARVRDPRRAHPGHAPLQLAPENRVLPMLGPPPKLRSTDNGNILHNGGTISGRKISQTQLVSPVKAYRARHDPRLGPPDPRGRPSSRNSNHGSQLSGSRSRFGGSEPDLRAPSPRHSVTPQPSRPPGRTPATAAAAAAARKKYKAPPPPPAGAQQDSESPSDTTWEEGGSGVPRRARLFKTRAQTNGSPAPTRPRDDLEKSSPRALGPAATNFLAQRSVSSPEFQMELVRAAQRRHAERQVVTPPSPAQHRPAQQRQNRSSPSPAQQRQSRESPAPAQSRTSRESPAPSQNRQSRESPARQSRESTAPAQQRQSRDSPARQSRESPARQSRESPAQRPTRATPTQQQRQSIASPTPAQQRQSRASPTPIQQRQSPIPAQQRPSRESPTPAGPRHAPVGREASGESKDTSRSGSSRSPGSEGGVKIQVQAASTPKTFYFGMESGGGTAAADEDEVDRFAARLRHAPRGMQARSSSPGSGASGSAGDEPRNDGDINLQLRPTLPKKTPDIPRFSPTAAWRQLLIEPSSPRGENEEDEDSEGDERQTPLMSRNNGGTAALLEERIVQSLLHRVPLNAAARGSVATHEKSGDSGISGDASPGPGATLLDSPDPAPVPHPRGRRSHNSPPTNRERVVHHRQWTPEQDLDDTSSEGSRSPPTRSPHQPRRTVSEERPGETAFRGERGRNAGRVTPPKFTRRSHMFSLSLPRPDQMQHAVRAYDDLESPIESPESPEGGFHSLQKIHRTSQQQLSLDENWYLSRSAPNSLDSSGGEAAVWGPRALTATPIVTASPEPDDSPPSSGPGFSYLATGGHIMYLPEYDSRRLEKNNVRPQLHAGQRSRSVDVLHQVQDKEMTLAAAQEMKELRPESPWGVEKEEMETVPVVVQPSKPGGKASKRFTFQSTIRQIERRRIADRLSREAERQEQQRKQEAEAMRRVEEDFQRKRAREKASLKEQLRLFSLQEPSGVDGPQSLPTHMPEPSPPPRARRVEPEGKANAQSDKDPCSRSREPREYRDYTASPAKLNSRYPSGERMSPTPGSPASGSGGRRAVLLQHPPAVFDIPKSTQVFVAPHTGITVTGPVVVGETPRNPEQHNYRREFARGAVPGGGGVSPRSGRVPRARLANSSSPEQDSGATRGHDSNFSSLPSQQAANSGLPRISGLQPFGAARSKGFRPIAFKPPGVSNATSGPKPAKLAQAVS